MIDRKRVRRRSMAVVVLKKLEHSALNHDPERPHRPKTLKVLEAPSPDKKHRQPLPGSMPALLRSKKTKRSVVRVRDSFVLRAQVPRTHDGNCGGVLTLNAN